MRAQRQRNESETCRTSHTAKENGQRSSPRVFSGSPKRSCCTWRNEGPCKATGGWRSRRTCWNGREHRHRRPSGCRTGLERLPAASLAFYSRINGLRAGLQRAMPVDDATSTGKQRALESLRTLDAVQTSILPACRAHFANIRALPTRWTRLGRFLCRMNRRNSREVPLLIRVSSSFQQPRRHPLFINELRGPTPEFQTALDCFEKGGLKKNRGWQSRHLPNHMSDLLVSQSANGNCFGVRNKNADGSVGGFYISV